MLITVLSTGDKVYRYSKSLVVLFEGKRNVLSTSPHNGGMRSDLTAVFNNDGTQGSGSMRKLKASTYKEHMALLAEELGLDKDHSAGISTAAHMENASIKAATFKDITVEAIATGGMDTNGGRAGDPAPWDELSNSSLQESEEGLGTINIILSVNCALTPGALARSLVMCTEAKTAAIEELMAPSRYSRGLATGTGTDGTIIISNAESKTLLLDAGKHVKLGELIGKTVKAAVKEALLIQSGISPERQHSVIRRADRFGITNLTLWQAYKGGKSRAAFEEALEEKLSSPSYVVPVALYAHLIDEVRYKLLSEEEAEPAANMLLSQMGYDKPAGLGEDALIESLKNALILALSASEDITGDSSQP